MSLEKVEDIMARKQNEDLLIEDELAAAFLSDDDLSTTDAPAPAANDDTWDDSEEEFPGQLAVDVYETEEKLVVKARTAGVNKEELDVSISDGILTISGTLSSGDDSEEEFPGQLAVDVYETEAKLVVKARTAGVNKEDLDVSISDGILTISGTLSSGDDDGATNWHIQECYWGEFSRTLALPVSVKEDEVEAVLKDGVLSVSFNKIKQEQAKKIQIQ